MKGKGNMLLTSITNAYGNKEYHLKMDASEYQQALNGKPIYRLTASAEIVGEWTVRFKKFNAKQRKSMNLL